MTLVIIITTLLCAIPYLCFVFIEKGNTIKRDKQFNEPIKGQNLNFSYKEQWNDKFLGIDPFQKTLVFICLKNKQFEVIKIDLKKVNAVTINKKTREFKKEKMVEVALQSLWLELTLQSSLTPITLPLYSVTEEFSEDFELKRAEKWLQYIQQHSVKDVLVVKSA